MQYLSKQHIQQKQASVFRSCICIYGKPMFWLFNSSPA